MRARALIAITVLLAGIVAFSVVRSWSRRGDAAGGRVDFDRMDIDCEISNAENRIAAIDSIRQAALKEIVARHAPALTSDPCDEEPTVNAWARWERFTAAPVEFEQAVSYSREWERLSSFQGLGVIDTLLPGESLEGPRSYHARTNLSAAREWYALNSAGEAWMTPAQARSWVAELGRLDAWDVDATLTIHHVSWPRWIEGEGWDFGTIEGVLWIWSYPRNSFVCAGPVRVQRLTSNRISREAGEVFGGPDMLSHSLRLRAAAQGARTLRRVANPHG